LQVEKFLKNLSAVDSEGGRAVIVHLEQPEKLLERIGELKK
jgi:hypothetical protein